jgi:hypothetical protein
MKKKVKTALVKDSKHPHLKFNSSEHPGKKTDCIPSEAIIEIRINDPMSAALELDTFQEEIDSITKDESIGLLLSDDQANAHDLPKFRKNMNGK